MCQQLPVHSQHQQLVCPTAAGLAWALCGALHHPSTTARLGSVGPRVLHPLSSEGSAPAEDMERIPILSLHWVVHGWGCHSWGREYMYLMEASCPELCHLGSQKQGMQLQG